MLRLIQIVSLTILTLWMSVSVAQPVAFTNVTVVDVVGGMTVPGMTVVVATDQISATGKTGTIEIPAGATVIDASGKFLMPGLWDMHVHVSSPRSTRGIIFPLFVAHGLTGVRVMAADCPHEGGCGEPMMTIQEIDLARSQIEKGTLIGPRIVAGSYFVNGPRGDEPSTVLAPGTPEHGRDLARWLDARGVDFIKVYDDIPREVYFALTDEANRLGLPFAGHVPMSIQASEASDAGQRSIEHCCMGNVLEECSAREDELRPQALAQFELEEPHFLPIVMKLVESFDADKCADLFARFVRNRTWFVPTLMISRLPSELGAGWATDPRFRFAPREEREFWKAQQLMYDQDLGNAEERVAYTRWTRQMTGLMQDAGVRLLAGSDAGDPGVFWGSGLHDELALLVAAGLTEAEALRAATLSPAEFLGVDDTLGTVEPGKQADLVLLAANPLEDISNTRRIEAVMTRGRLFDREALDALLAGAEQAAQP